MNKFELISRLADATINENAPLLLKRYMHKKIFKYCMIMPKRKLEDLLGEIND